MKYSVLWVSVTSFWMNVGYANQNILKHAEALPALSSTEQITQVLYKSIKVHNTQAARVAITLGAHINAHDATTGYTPLIYAITMGDVAMVRTLLVAGADCTRNDRIDKSTHYYVQLLAQEKKQQADAIMNLLNEYK